jgi:hypothetical protein
MVKLPSIAIITIRKLNPMQADMTVFSVKAEISVPDFCDVFSY